MSKKLIPLVNKYIVWDGTFDTSWKTKDSDGVCHITTPEQFADFFLDHTQSSKSGISNVVLDNDICMNEDFENALDWTSSTNIKIIDKTTRNNFMDVSLTFDGQGHTIYGFANRVSADFASSYWANNGNTLTFKNVRFYGRYIETTKGSNCFWSLCGFDNGRYKFEGVQYHKFKVNNLVNGMSGRTKNLFSCCAQNTYCDIDVQFVDCEFANQDYIFSSDANATSTIPSGSTLKISVNGGTSSTRLINGSKTTTIQNDVHSVVYNLNNTIPTDSSYPFVNPIVDENLESYVSTHNDFSDYEFDENCDYEDLQPLNPGNLKIYEPFVKPLSIPEGSDFLWRAKEYDASTNSIRNLVENSYFGTLNIMNTPTFVDGDKKYLNFTNVNQYLYHSLDSNAQQNILGNGDNHYYTIIFKTLIESSTPSAIIMNLTKSKTSNFNMLWKTPSKNTLEVSTGGNNMQQTNVDVINQLYIKYERTNSQVTLTCLDTGVTQTISLSGTQYIEDEIRFMSAGHTWSYCNRFYGVYGAPRQLNDKETQDVVKILNGEDPKYEPPTLRYQSRTEVDEPKFNVWDGVTYDGSWWNESSSILNIDTAAQVADFFRNQNNYKLDGKTVNFNNNFYMNLNYRDCHNWTDTSNDFYWIKPNGKCVNSDNNNTETIIDGKCHTIYGLAICDYTTNERPAIMVLNNIATIKDLRFDGLWSWERKSYGRLFKFYSGRAKIYNVVLCNSNIVDYGFSSYKASVVNFGDYSKGNNEVNMVLYNNKLNITTSPGFMGRAVYGTNVKYNVCAYSNIAVNSGILFPVSQLTVDSGSNYEYYDMSGFTNSGISCDSVESLIESYNSNHVFSDERELYIDENNNPTFWDESHEQIFPSDYIYVDEKVGQVTNILKDQTFPYTQQADYRDMYTWALWGHTVNSSTTGIEWTIATPCTITFECWQSSEANYDYGHIDKNGSEIKSWKGQGSTHSTYEASFVAGDKLRLRYTKDGSQTKGDDTFYCKMMIDGLGIDEHGDCFVGTTVRHWYKLGEKKLLLINKKDIGE